MKPSVGRIVHFKGEKNEPCRAAIITAVDENNVVELTVFHKRARIAWARVGHEDGNALETMMGSWHWPERVDAAEAKQ